MTQLERLLGEVLEPGSPLFPTQFLLELVEQKLRLFPEDRRFIADFKIKGHGKHAQIIVATPS
jgi:hypothetical protein